MAFPIHMVNRNTGAQALGFKGFSWTCFFFGPFPALFRGHILGFFGMLIAAVFTFGLSGLVFMFIYNGWHFNWLSQKGYSAIGLHNASPANIINVSVGNVGTVDNSQSANFLPGLNTAMGNEADGFKKLPTSQGFLPKT